MAGLPCQVARLKGRRGTWYAIAAVQVVCSGIKAGADYVIVGRSIYGAEEPRAAAESFRADIRSVLAARRCFRAHAVHAGKQEGL